MGSMPQGGKLLEAPAPRDGQWLPQGPLDGQQHLSAQLPCQDEGDSPAYLQAAAPQDTEAPYVDREAVGGHICYGRLQPQQRGREFHQAWATQEQE